MLPPLSAKALRAERIQVFNVRPIKRIDRDPTVTDEDSAPESVLDTEYWLDRNGDFNILNRREHEWDVDNKSEIVLEHGIRHSETSDHWDVRATLNVAGFVWPIRRSTNKADNVLVAVGTMDARRSTAIKTT